MTAYLLAESGVATPLHKGTVRVGSDASAELAFTEDLRLSRFHYEIVSSGEGHAIYKLDADSRLLVNDKPVNDAQLQDGDVITAGATTLIYCSKVPDPPSPFAVAQSKPPPTAAVEEDQRASRVLAAFITTAFTAFAYSFVCNLGWVLLIICAILTGHLAGWLVKVIGNEHDRCLGLLAAVATLSGVLIVNLLTHGGVLHMYEVITVPGPAATVSPKVSEPEEEEMTKVGTGETAAKVAGLTMSDVWQRFMPARQTSDGRMKIVPATGLTTIFFGSKSLLAYVFITLAAYRRAARKSIKVVPLDVTP